MEPTVAKVEGAAEPAVAVGRSETKVKRILQSAGLGLVVQHWIALETRAIPSLFILIAQAFPSLAFLVSFLSDRIRFYWLLIVFLVVYLLWRTRKHQLEPKQKATLRRILSYLKPHWPYLSALSTSIVAAAALDLAQPWIIAILLVGEVLLKSNLGFLPLVVGLLVGTFVVKEIASFFKDYLSEVLSQKTVHRLRTDLYQTVELLPVTYLDSSRAGAMICRVVTGLRIVKSFVMEHHEANAFRERSFAISKARVRLARLAGAYGSTVDFLTLCALVAVVWVGAPAVVSRGLSLAAFIAFLSYMDKTFKPLVLLSKVNLTFQKVSAAGDRIFELMDSEVEVLETPDALVPTTTEGRIEFDHVTFGYRPNHNVLEDFSLVIEPGETVAVVGSSGTGKSTVVNLLLRFYQPASGRILIDDYPVDRLNLKSLRGMIGLVLQEPVLFSGTIRENILYGDPEASDEDVVRAARLANAHDFIAGLPKSYETEIGERGVTLSVGQRQRIAIARALLKDPKILILDEATSNIDSESESLIQDALRRLTGQRTMIVIGHRLSSIMDADRIVVLEDGGIAEVGTHEGLLGKRGVYSRLYEAQIARGTSDGETRDELL